MHHILYKHTECKISDALKLSSTPNMLIYIRCMTCPKLTTSHEFTSNVKKKNFHHNKSFRGTNLLPFPKPYLPSHLSEL